MPSLDEEIEDVGSSTASELDEASTTPVEQPELSETTDAKSSAATGEEDKDLLSVVRDVVDKSKADASTASPAEGEDSKEVTDGAVVKKADDENYSDVPFHKHPRFQHLLRKTKALEVDAGRYQNVQKFLDDAGMSGEEASDILTIGALIKTNPAEAWKRMKPVVQQVLIAAGEVLPDDLQSRVQNGELSSEAALEVSRHRATAQSFQVAQTFREQQTYRSQQQAAASAVQNAAVSWEQDRRLKDPNFDAKLAPLMAEVQKLQTLGWKPTTPEGVAEQLQRAYRAVNAQIAPAAIAPPQRQKPPITPIRGGQVAGSTRPTELSTLDIVRQHTRG